MTSIIQRMAAAVVGFVVAWALGFAFLLDKPFEEIEGGFKEWQIGLIFIVFSPYFAWKSFKEYSSE